jgi:hypothetical protein
MAALIVICMVLLSAIPAYAAPASADKGDNNNIQVTRIVVEPRGQDLNMTVYYDTNMFTRVFSMFFGAKTIQPSVEGMFANFTNVSVTRIDMNDNLAEVHASRQMSLDNNGMYEYTGNAAFPMRVQRLEVRDTSVGPMIVENADSLPFFTTRA